MPTSIQLNTWIAESESWQSFIDFHLPNDSMANYSFLLRTDDFYLSLMSRAIELFEEKNDIKSNKELLSLAKGLEIFSLKEKREHFNGVNHSNNILYASSLYYLSDYAASAWILANIYSFENYSNDIDLFISNFLKRKLNDDNRYERIFKKYLQRGDNRILKWLIRSIRHKKERIFNEDIELYFSLKLAEKILIKFQEDNIWKDLLKSYNDRDHWNDYVNKSINKTVPVWSFFPSQKLGIEKGILNGTTCSLQMPTSSGKSSISELIIYDEFKKNRSCKILYLAPFRALASELKQSLAVSLGELGIRSKTIYGGNLPTMEERTSINEVNLLIATPEKFMAIEDVFPGIYREFTTIICDEGHLLDDSSRGLSYELLLSRLKESSEPMRRFIFISAIIPNISIINSWLGGTNETFISSNYRPTELEYAFLKRMGGRAVAYYLDMNPLKERPYNYQLYKYLDDDDLNIINPKSGKREKLKSKAGLSVAVALKATRSGTVALFAPHKRGNTGVEGLVNAAIYQLKNKTNISLLNYSPDYFLKNLNEYFSHVFDPNYLLTEACRLGVLFHHADFPQSIREIIEDALRNGNIRLVVCTNTLAEGVNLPIKTIVLHSTRRFNPDVIGKSEPMKVRDLKNLVGRAGRAGKETKGLVIVPHSEDFDTIQNLINESNIDPIKGQLYNIISLITKALQRKRLLLTTEILDSLEESFQQLLDSIDLSMIDLLAEEVEPDNLKSIIKESIKDTLSFYQSNESEKGTLDKLFELRTEKLKPIINRGDFRILKNSGTNIRLFEEIISHFDFEDKIWNQEIKNKNEEWLIYILDNGVFQLKRYSYDLASFNETNKCDLNNNAIKTAIQLWMKGNWFNKIKNELNIEMHQTLRLINSLISFNIQSIVSSVIRVKELKNPNNIFPTIQNFPSLLQHGIDSQLKLDLIEMGLIDRISILALGDHLDSIEYVHSDYKTFREYLRVNGTELLELIKVNIPNISFDKAKIFIEQLNYRNIY